VGNRRTWNVSIDKNLWGFSEKTRGLWNTSKEGDFVVFYVTNPTKKIIGFGKFERKFIDNKKIWVEEKLVDESIWKYKIKLKIIYVNANWSNGVSLSKKIIVNTGRKKIDKGLFENLVQQLKNNQKSRKS
jgi:predicted RNA-binding protein